MTIRPRIGERVRMVTWVWVKEIDGPFSHEKCVPPWDRYGTVVGIRKENQKCLYAVRRDRDGAVVEHYCRYLRLAVIDEDLMDIGELEVFV